MSILNRPIGSIDPTTIVGGIQPGGYDPMFDDGSSYDTYLGDGGDLGGGIGFDPSGDPALEPIAYDPTGDTAIGDAPVDTGLDAGGVSTTYQDPTVGTTACDPETDPNCIADTSGDTGGGAVQCDPETDVNCAPIGSALDCVATPDDPGCSDSGGDFTVCDPETDNCIDCATNPSDPLCGGLGPDPTGGWETPGGVIAPGAGGSGGAGGAGGGGSSGGGSGSGSSAGRATGGGSPSIRLGKNPDPRVVAAAARTIRATQQQGTGGLNSLLSTPGGLLIAGIVIVAVLVLAFKSKGGV